MKMINSGVNVYIASKNKKDNQISGQSRASKFKGVSKNGNNWQVLININYNKKYVGTFETEVQAALAYDFYAISFHKLEAKTNFSYSQELIADMISGYLSNNNEFIPRNFEDRVKPKGEQ
jgi:hypothetical protein